MTFELGCTLLGIGLLSVAVPVAIFIGRNNIRYIRQQILNDLEKIFRFKDRDGDKLIPSFEFVAYKYRALPGAAGKRSDYSAHAFVVPTAIYVVLTFLGFVMVSGLRGLESGSPYFWLGTLAGTLDVTGADAATYWRQSIAVVCTTFLGGYIWSIQYLIRRIANFDLSPTSFLRVAAHIVLGTFVAITLRHVWYALSPANWVPEIAVATSLNWILGPAFLIGFFPTMGVQILLEKFPRLQLKRVEDAARQLCRELPLDMVDGIDPFIKFRLNEFEIEDVQNLATANPILLFVETPYGIYETINWVAQAQLIVAVTPEQLARLRDLGIRQIFDLREYVKHAQTRDLLAKALAGDNGAQQIGDEAVRGMVAAVLGNLHVRRLEQIWRAIERKLTFVEEKPPSGAAGEFFRVAPSQPVLRAATPGRARPRHSGGSPRPMGPTARTKVDQGDEAMESTGGKGGGGSLPDGAGGRVGSQPSA